jgi:hypothetical protein
MANIVYANGREVTQESTGRQIAVFPDVCKTPSPGGPVPIPYPNIATNDGARTKVATKQVKVTSKPAISLSSKMSTSTGDEAGTMKGISSATTFGKQQYLRLTMDVKAEGKNVAVIAQGHVVNAPPPVPCGNPACKYSRIPIAASLTARLPTRLRVDFPNRLVCLECYRKIVGKEPLPAGSNLAAPFIPGGSVLGAAIGG